MRGRPTPFEQRRARKGSRITARQWREKCEAFGYRCAYCGKAPALLCMEHVEPWGPRGGEDVIENIVPACQPCNSSKSDFFLMEWMLVRHGFWKRGRGARRSSVRVA